MWFKNLIIYRFSEAFEQTPETLETALARAAFRPCASQELASHGWVAPLGERHSQQLVHAAANGGFMLLCLRRESRLLPASVVRERVDEKVEEIETAEQRRLRKKERDEIRDAVLLELTPRAFTKRSHHYALLAPAQGLLLIDAGSVKQAEELAALLRKTLGELPVAFPSLPAPPSLLFTRWIDGSEAPPADFEPGDECELSDPAEGGAVVRCRRQPLEADEVRGHIEAGKRVTRLAVAWSDQLECVLGDDLSVKRLRFADRLKEEAAEQAGGEDAAAQFDADFVLMSETLVRFVPRLLELLGSES